MECKVAVSLMHDYLDDDLVAEQRLELKKHLVACPACQKQFQELERTDMFLFSLTHHTPTVSDDLTNRILNALPKHQKSHSWVQWIKRHPAITAAAIFFIVMFSSSVSFWDQDNRLAVHGNDLDQIIIEGDTVIVPEGSVIAGDLTIENGKAQIFGEVQGNLTVIDGTWYQASTAHIAGQVKSVDRALDWIWYKITNLFTDVAYR